ncbi:WbqC family protein [Kiritimatiellaeota bacterium B1221]|nr:WbqC family protein [Kiritimatiellaeota bacterium B1221]
MNNSKFAVMQPYFFPYIGYFQLIQAVDKFVIYDNIEFTKKGWMNRNRILVNGIPQYFTVNVEKGSDYAMVNERNVSNVFVKEHKKILAKIEGNYRKSSYFDETFPVIKECVVCKEINLFEYINYSIRKIVEHLEIKTELIISSTLSIDHSLKNKHKLWAISKSLNIKKYINPLGGKDLYEKNEFLEHGVDLMFHQAKLSEYPQIGSVSFIPALSIIDVLMNLGKEGTKAYLEDYHLL